MSISATEIKKLLQEKHKQDVFVPECKTGSTVFNSGLRILDAWVMKKSYGHPLTIGYEIKVNRNDFLSDQKWHQYLPYCNEFYFVCTGGLIAPNELPAEAGLYYVSKTGTTLFQKKKAVYRHIEIPTSIFKYILMSRIKIISAQQNYESSDKKAFWQEWLKNQKLDNQFGAYVSKKISKKYFEEYKELQLENERLNHEIAKLQMVKDTIAKLDMKYVYGFNFEKQLTERMAYIKSRLSGGLDVEIDRAIDSLSKIKKIIEEKEEEIL